MVDNSNYCIFGIINPKDTYNEFLKEESGFKNQI
jgi:hypothetical protein